MKSTGKFLALAISIVSHFMILEFAAAQTTSTPAASWFNRGLSERDPQKKIEAYQRAVEYDSTFVEALFNLALIYMQQNDFANSEKFFNKALTIRDRPVNAKLKSQIFFYLAMVNKQTDNLQSCEANLLEAKKIVQDKPTRMIISSELGRLYFKQLRYQEALQELREGRELDKSNQSFFDNLIQIIEKEMALERLYKEAELSIARGDLLQANSLLMQVKAANPNFRDVNEKIAMTDSLLKDRAEGEILNELYQQAARYADEGALQNAITTYEILLQQSPDFMDAKQRLGVLKETFEKQERARILADEFALGMDALSKNNWTRAIIAFEKVLELDPAHVEARKKLAQANRGLQEQGTEYVIKQFYNDALSAIDRGESAAGLAALEKVRNLSPNFKNTDSLIANLESAANSSRIDAASPLGNYYNTLYEDAVKSLDQKNWMQAVLKLEKLRVLKPDDSNVVNLLTHARANLKLASATEKNSRASRSTMLYFGGALAAVVVLPAIGVLFFSATSRARFQFLRGNYLRAAQIYERLLTQHPDKVKLYVKLANIYLISGRDDDRALKVFKVIVSLNLAPHIHPQINSIITQKYLTDGANSSEAIAVLESALKAEQNKHDQI